MEPTTATPPTPAADHHQHVFSPVVSDMLAAESRPLPVITADDIAALLDAAGIRRALLLSAGYMYGSPARTVADEYAKVHAENDWAGEQAARHPDRMVAFGSFNPLREYVLDEIARCAVHPHLRRGIKLHLGNSDVQLDDPAHVARLGEVFRAANKHGMAVVVHLRASISRNRPYGADQGRAFLEEILPLAPDVPVQVAHLAGAGPGYRDDPAHAAMGVLAEAVERGDARTRHLWFDVATVADRDISPEDAALAAGYIRRVGVGRVFYGSDAAAGGNLRPREAWEAFRRLPLRDDEFARIAANLAPYFG